MDRVGRIINIQHFSVDDGPGIRTAVFLKGCPLKCAWCHNPESQSAQRELMFRAETCTGCGDCTVCAKGLHKVSGGMHGFDRAGCTACGACAGACSFGALETVGKDMTVSAVLEEVLLDRVFYRGVGGVTVTGGEPLMQPEFTAALLRACREMGVHTCVETCGFGSAEALEEVRKHTDLFLFDYKVTGDERHRKYTGVSNQTILRNLDALCGRGAEVILRCPMIPGVNLEAAHADAIAQLACRYESIKEIHLEPYHPLGLSKNAALGRKAAYDRADFLDKGDVEPIAESIRARVRVGVRVV